MQRSIVDHRGAAWTRAPVILLETSGCVEEAGFWVVFKIWVIYEALNVTCWQWPSHDLQRLLEGWCPPHISRVFLFIIKWLQSLRWTCSPFTQTEPASHHRHIIIVKVKLRLSARSNRRDLMETQQQQQVRVLRVQSDSNEVEIIY